MELFKLFLGNISEGKREEKKPEQNCVGPLEERMLTEAPLKLCGKFHDSSVVGLRASTAGGVDSICDWETKNPQGKQGEQTNKQKLCDLESIHPFGESFLIC